MKNIILKSSKQILSLVIAFSVLAVSLFTGITITANAADGITDTWDGSYSQPTAKDTDGTTILISTAEELAWVILQSGTAGAGVTYKVADGITAFYMNENTADLTLEQVKNKLDGNNTNAWECQGNAFQGTLDGNGVAIYGLYSEGTTNDTKGNYGALVPTVTGSVTIKNLAVKNSYIGGYLYASAIVGYAKNGDLTSLTVEKCVITNNYLYHTRTASTTSTLNYSVGVIGGYIGARDVIPCYVTVNNCAIYDNELYSALGGNISGIFAYLYTKSDNANANCYQFTNLMISGAAPWSGNDNSHARRTGNFVNVYIDTDKTNFTYDGANTGIESGYGTLVDGSIELLDTADMQGAAAETNMPNLAWGTVWQAADSGFPIATFINENADLIGGDGGDTGDGTTSTADDTWDGTIATAFESGTGTKADPFIIKTAEQLAYLASGADGATGGHYYKVADGITAFDMNGFEGITLDSTLADVKTATKTGKDWSATYNETNAFCGVFDGNEVTVYNLYGKSAAMGLFPCVQGYADSTAQNVTIKNITVKNSYFEATGSGYNYGAGGIFGKHTNTGSAYPLTIEKCAVEDCYIANTNTADTAYAGAIGGTVRWATAIISNCLAADNGIVGGTVSTGGLVAAAQNTSAITASGCVVIGTTPYPTGTQGTAIEHTNFTDLIAPASYSTTYTDQTVGSTYTGITTLTTAQMTGDAATTNMTGLDWGSNWKVRENDYPTPTNPVIPDGAWDGEEATDYAGGDGSETNPFIIENAAQLYKMVKDGGEDSNGNAAYFKVKDGVYDIYANPVEDMTSDEIKAYFADNTTYKAVWDPQTTEFNGNFDGNGVTIHGLYNVKAATGAGVAFLPQVSNSKAFINNVQFSDCYFENTGASNGGTSAAVLVGRSDNSTINFNNVAVCDSTAKCAAYVAAVFVAQNGATVTIDTAFTSGNTLYSEYYYSESLTYTYEGILYGNTSNYLYTIKNSVFTETDEYMSRVHYKVSIKFENSYVAGLTAASITGISVSEISQSSMIGESAKTNMPDLDWTAWIATDSYPVIAALHDLSYTVDGNNGHGISCNDCEDISISLEDHTYDSNYVCLLCGFEHSHTLVDNGIDYDATCVDSGVMNVKCEYCDYTSTREICAKTHNFGEVIAATAGDCKTEATVAYKTCSQCELCFAPDEDITSTNPLDHIGTGYTARHDWVAQTPIEFVCADKTVEYFKCSVCAAYLVEGVMADDAPSTEGDAHVASGNYEIHESNHADICGICGESYDAQAHTDENGDSICDICGWPCGEHVFDGASITLTDSIAVNYKIKKSVVDVLGYSDLYIKFTFCGKSYTVSEYTENDTYYVFTFDSIAPNRMSDTIYATLYGTKSDTAYESEKCEYSIRQYCGNMLQKYSDDESLRTLLVDLLNYGAQSQIYTDYNTSDLANANLTTEQAAWGTTGEVVTESVQNLKYQTITDPTVKWKAAGLYLDEEATMRFTIQTDSIENLIVRAECGATSIEIPSSEFIKRNDVDADNMYYVYVRGINVSQMRDEVYLTVCNGETAVSNTICYSVESYAHAKLNDANTADELKNLLIAMIKYGDAAKAYLDVLNNII